MVCTDFASVIDTAFAAPEQFEQKLAFQLTPIACVKDDWDEQFDDVVDVFCVGPQPSSRWRAFVDCKNWTPEKHHDELLNRRTYHAKMVYEQTLLLQTVEPDWLSTKHISYIRAVALVELRTVELHIASYQLTCQMVGIKGSCRDDLYLAATMAFSLHLHIYDRVCSMMSVKKGRGEVLADKPGSTDSRAALVKTLDAQLHACHTFLQMGRDLIKEGFGEKEVCELGKRMTLTIRALDKVFIVL